MPQRMNESELMEHAFALVPKTGEISYRDLHASIKASAQPDAVKLLPRLKQEGRIKARLEVLPDGTLIHAYSRTGGG